MPTTGRAMAPMLAVSPRRAGRRLLHLWPMASKDEILTALERVIDPELGKSIVELGMVRSIEISDAGAVDVMVSLTTPGCPIRNHFVEAVTREAGTVDGVTKVDVAFDVLSDAEKGKL